MSIQLNDIDIFLAEAATALQALSRRVCANTDDGDDADTDSDVDVTDGDTDTDSDVDVTDGDDDVQEIKVPEVPGGRILHGFWTKYENEYAPFCNDVDRIRRDLVLFFILRKSRRVSTNIEYEYMNVAQLFIKKSGSLNTAAPNHLSRLALGFMDRCRDLFPQITPDAFYQKCIRQQNAEIARRFDTYLDMNVIGHLADYETCVSKQYHYL